MLPDPVSNPGPLTYESGAARLVGKDTCSNNMLFQYDNVNGSIDDLRFDVLSNSNSAIPARLGEGEVEQGDNERLSAI